MKKNILVVNNENDIRDSYEQILGEDLQVVKTSNEKEALKKVSKKNFHLLIIDLDFPGIKRLELLRMVRKIDSKIPVIMISVINKVEMAVEAMKSGTNNYFTKPFNLTEFRETVEELSAKYVEGSHRLPLDIEIVADEVREDMLAKGIGLREAEKNFEKKLLKTVLEKANGDEARAAHFLGVDNKILSGKMATLNLAI